MGRRGLMMRIVVHDGADPLPATPLPRVDDARAVRFVTFLHGRIPVILDGIIRPVKE